ncbi:DALR anticodon-binding domain-containing protein 3 isoform X2 [Chroicocephalus ridibundus]|uniref:DALR anticodon-binding domain-containing protein 3 isoform X2 n=1 Tax=Chroicocephalus ridibundus TaxID=1192867 RepID=UPI002FDC99C3
MSRKALGGRAAPCGHPSHRGCLGQGLGEEHGGDNPMPTRPPCRTQPPPHTAPCQCRWFSSAGLFRARGALRPGRPARGRSVLAARVRLTPSGPRLPLPGSPLPLWRRRAARHAHHGGGAAPVTPKMAALHRPTRPQDGCPLMSLPASAGRAGSQAPMEAGEGRPGLAATLRALNGALGRPEGLCVKESGARNLRHRDFLAPRAALNAAFPGGQVPADIMSGVTSLGGPGVLEVRGCQETPAGLAVQLRRPEAFRRLLGSPSVPSPSPPPSGPRVVLHCPALRRPAALRPRHLRPLLLADHLAQLLRAQGVGVRLVPALPEEGSREVLRQLRIDWPSSSGSLALLDAISALKQALGRSPCAAACEQAPGAAALPEDVICKVHLKSFVEEQGLVGYDPNLDVLLVTEEKLRSLAELQQAVLQCTAEGQGSCCSSIVHVVSCEEEFQQQQLDLLWRILDPGAHTALQKHLVCGPVKVTNPSSPIGADQYFQAVLRGLEGQNGATGSSPVLVASSSSAALWPSVMPGGKAAAAGAEHRGSAGWYLPAFTRYWMALVWGRPFLSQKAEPVPSTAASLWLSPGSGTRGYPRGGCPCPAPGGFVQLLLGWVAAAAGVP